MAMIELHVPGMTYRHSVRVVTARLRDLPGVVMVTADAAAAKVVVHGDVSEEQVRAALAGVTFPANSDTDGRQTADG